MSVTSKIVPFETAKGVAEGVDLKWDSFSLLILTAPKGFLACCIFDEKIIGEFGVPCAVVNSGPGNSIGTLENMFNRTIMKVNEKGHELGIKVGMPTMEALELLF
jgi:uncharacterized protein YunC (DUF1805 family)